MPRQEIDYPGRDSHELRTLLDEVSRELNGLRRTADVTEEIIRRQPVPTASIGFAGDYQEFIQTQLIPRLNRAARNVRGWAWQFEWTPGNNNVHVSGYSAQIKIFPEDKKVQGAVGNLPAGHTGRVHVKVLGLPATPGVKTDFTFGVHPTGTFNAIALLNRLKAFMPLLDQAMNVPHEPTHDEIIAIQTKAEESKRTLAEAATKRAALWETLGEMLVQNGFQVESNKEDEFFNLKFKSGITAKLEVIDGGVKLKELELPDTFPVDSRFVKMLNAFSEMPKE